MGLRTGDKADIAMLIADSVALLTVGVPVGTIAGNVASGVVASIQSK
jgi:hypothetical protein